MTADGSGLGPHAPGGVADAAALRRSDGGNGEPLRVLHVVNFLALAGMEYGVIKLVHRLDADRFAPMVCCLRQAFDAARRLVGPTIPVFELGGARRRDLALIARLARLLREQRVDVVHSHNRPTYMHTVLAAALAGVPVVIHGEHGREGAGAPHVGVLERFLGRRVDRFVAVSDDLGRTLTRQWRVEGGRVWSIANGVDLEVFGQPYAVDALRQELGWDDANPVVLNVGGLRTVKDHPTLLRAFARLRAEVPAARLLIIGDDNRDGTRARLEQLAADLGLGAAVRFAGVRHDVPQLLALADVYVNMSRFEGMSNTILEAMAAGKPVVATRVGGNPELVDDQVTGFLFAPGDHEALAAHLAQLLSGRDLACRLGEAGRRRVEQRHSLVRMTRAYGDLYLEAWMRRAPVGRRQAKSWAASGLRWIGAGWMRTRLEAPQLVILAYHRVLPAHEAREYPFQGMVMPRDTFAAQMGHLAERYTVLPLAEAVTLLRRGQLPRRAVAVTFDDGYRDNYEHAWPLLARFGIPATFFLVTDGVDGALELWWDRVTEIVRRWIPNGDAERHSALLPDWLVPLRARRRRGEPVAAVAQVIVRRLNDVSLAERRTTLAALEASVGELLTPSDLLLSWEQVRTMRNSGMSFGAHSLTHAFVDEIPPDEARREIEGSMLRVEAALGTGVRLFSYPRGRTAPEIRRLLAELGTQAAVTTAQGRNPAGSDPLQLRRIDAGYCRTAARFDGAAFDAELGGWFAALRSA